MILWKGHCSVHGRFALESVVDVRERVPGVNVLVHPECKHEVVTAADLVGSTEFIIKTVEAAPRRQRVGDRHRAQPGQAPRARAPRQADRLPRQDRVLLRDDEPHRPAAPGVGAREPRRRAPSSTASTVDPDVAHWARVALDRMLALPGVGAAPADPAGLTPRR